MEEREREREREERVIIGGPEREREREIIQHYPRADIPLSSPPLSPLLCNRAYTYIVSTIRTILFIRI